ncbi:unnamed protein product [Cladocopium goreaui]|uniref:25S rRNA (Uridine-N(3))-methyltransferase BMT5-like domain-containing protein n=1 Tax=Cladocopium goreaui TaxID=2562237 RepID=A0A9P1GR76_9DINO|nr:unnamed protein product [Cladocopium goreaui]
MGCHGLRYTEYPSLYCGPCNVNRDASVKPTDAVIFLYVHRESSTFRHAIEAAASSWKYCCSPGVLQGPFDFRCEVCHVSTRTAADFAAHNAGKMHRKRVALEEHWEAALNASRGRLMEVTCNLHGEGKDHKDVSTVSAMVLLASRLFWWVSTYCPCGPAPFSRAVPGMPRLQVHPIASRALDVDLDDGTTLAALKRALAERTGIAVEEQRLVLRGKLLEETTGAGILRDGRLTLQKDDVDVSSIDGRIFLARRTTGRRGETEEVQLTVKMVDGVSHPGIRINSSLDRLARDFQQEVLLQMNLPLELGYKFVTKGRLISEVLESGGKLGRPGLVT